MLLLWGQQVLLDQRMTIYGGSTRLGSLTIAWSSQGSSSVKSWKKKKSYLILSRGSRLHFSDNSTLGSTDYTRRVLTSVHRRWRFLVFTDIKSVGAWLNEETRHWKFDFSGAVSSQQGCDRHLDRCVRKRLLAIDQRNNDSRVKSLIHQLRNAKWHVVGTVVDEHRQWAEYHELEPRTGRTSTWNWDHEIGTIWDFFKIRREIGAVTTQVDNMAVRVPEPTTYDGSVYEILRNPRN